MNPPCNWRVVSAVSDGKLAKRSNFSSGDFAQLVSFTLELPDGCIIKVLQDVV